MKRFAVGIDLGTTHTVVAYAEPAGSDIRLFEIEQLVAPGEVKALPLLPSLRFHPAPGELPANELQLPWSAAGDSGQEPVVIGMLARKLGAQVPGRLVASAKSWLSHGAVDRTAPILPWGAADEVRKVSPLEASASYLAYVRAAWNWRFPQHPLEEQEIVLTVPASFDEGARELTLNAARMAGLPHLRLLEEPQAAFYDWLFRHRAALAGELADTRLILVCDVGGGTTDLSLITAGMRDGQPQLTRIGVGKHLMLGGDNMDLVLAHIAESRLTPANDNSGAGGRLSAGRLSQLLERCRAAKEQLLGAGAPAAVTVTLLGSGARVIGGSRSAELTREEAARVILDGFFPAVDSAEPVQQRRSGIVEFGLPYASDPAITRHIAAFLQRHAAEARQALGLPDSGDAPLPMPDTLLLNGGVFRSDLIVRQLESTLANWRGAPLRLLDNHDPDVAVARGAVAYTLARSGLGASIGGGSPRSYFLVLDDRSHGRQGVCVLPRGSEQGKEVRLRDRSFALRLGQPVRFHLVSSTAGESGGRPHRAGELIDLDGGDFVQLPPIATVLRGAAAGAKAEIPVQLATALTEIGTLEMHCVSIDDPDRRWKLEFQLRGDGADATESDAAADLPPRFSEALAKIDRIFGARAQKVVPKEVRQLRAQLEKLIGQREGWPTPLLRRLADALLQRARGRRRSAEHERVWLNLTGYCLRPGFGYPLDDWRTQQLWALFEAGAQYRNDAQVCAEWWTMWRRVAGGLETDAQLRLLDDFALNVAEDEVQDRPPGLVKGGYDDMLRLVAALERIPASYKAEIGDWLLGLLGKDKPPRRGAAVPDSLVLWTLARVGARQPFHGSAHDVVPPETAAAWVDAVMALDWKHQEAAPFAAAHLARLTGDRSRDLPQSIREQVMRRLEAAGAPQAWIEMIREAVQLDESAERSFLGDSLPPGLKLIA